MIADAHSRRDRGVRAGANRGTNTRRACFGIFPGVLGAYLAARAMSALLFGIAPGDPPTFAAAVGVALVITLAGSLVPALRPCA